MVGVGGALSKHGAGAGAGNSPAHPPPPAGGPRASRSATVGAPRMEPRPSCSTCLRPLVVCWCAHLQPRATRNAVLFLQHPREEDVAIGTARMASLSLVGSELEVGVDFSRSRALARAIADEERPPVLLFPGPHARDLGREPPEHPVRLVVIDGTWAQAKKIVRVNPALAALPRYAFTPPAPSAYTIRREPQADFVSTVESLAHVLSILEGDPSFADSLTAPFHAMVAQQVRYAETVRAARHRRRVRAIPRDREPPAILRERFDDLVCVVAETNAWPEGSPERIEGDPGELVHLVAVRPASGEVLDLVAPPPVLAPWTAKHLELSPTLLSGAPVDLRAPWRALVRPTDVLVTWGTHSLAALARAGLASPEPAVDLRFALRVMLRHRLGAIEELHARALGAVGAHPRGRAGRRAAMMAELVCALREPIPFGWGLPPREALSLPAAAGTPSPAPRPG